MIRESLLRYFIRIRLKTAPITKSDSMNVLSSNPKLLQKIHKNLWLRKDMKPVCVNTKCRLVYANKSLKS